MAYDIDKIRAQMKKMAGKPQDPFEYRPPKAKAGETIKHRFYVLPPLQKGDKCHGGTATKDMGNAVCIKHGNHWVNNKPNACPRVLLEEECELCQAGFDLLGETNDKDKRGAIVKQFLAQTSYAVNVYFPPIEPNPEELRDKVLWFNAQKTIFDIWHEALMRDNGGDEEDPQAFGIYYNEQNAFLFQIQIQHSGTYNDYRTSKFLAKIGPMPIAATKDKKPDDKKIQKILDSRHDLYLKVEQPNPKKIHQLCQVILHGAEEIDEQSTISDDNLGDSIKNEMPVVNEEPKTMKTAPKSKDNGVKKKPTPEVVTQSASSTHDDAKDDEDIDAILAKLQSGE